METTQVTGFRRRVLRKIAEFTWNDCLPDRIYDLLYKTVRDDTPRVRCCVHKERAVLKNRIQMALWQPLGLNIINAANAALTGEVDKSLPVMDLLPQACDECPLDSYYVTDVCRHCVQKKCIDQCPKKAISVVNGKAFIDKDECMHCGICRRVCPFKAITEIVRPCLQACGLKALYSGPDKRTVIDRDKCVSCGSCRSACPFGALDERSLIVQVILALKQKKKITALLAPSFVNQLGAKISAGQLMAGLHKVGFTDIVEAAIGADMTALHETEEFLNKVPDKQEYMTSSCCPAFVTLVKKHFPEMTDKISETVSPMIATGRWLKSKDPDALVCFIGPCIAKKTEAIANPDAIDYVLTYEELQCLFEGIGIDLATIEAEPYTPTASTDAMGFPLNRGVQKSVLNLLKKEAPIDAVLDYQDGIGAIKDKLTLLKNGKLNPQPAYIEGMACVNGCIDGPGTMIQPGLARVMVTKLGNTATAKTSDDNQTAVYAITQINMETKHS